MRDIKKDSSMLKLKLLSEGVDFEGEPPGMGNTIKEEYRALFDARLSPEHDMVLPPELVLPGEIVAKTIYRPNSRFEVRIVNSNNPAIFDKDSGKKVSSVNFPPRPNFYNFFTSSGVPMKQVGQLLGLDCMGIIINSYCARWEGGRYCKFCNINPTTSKDQDTIRTSEEILETVKKAREDEEFQLVNLTGGTWSSPKDEFTTYMDIAEAIKNVMGRKRLPGVSSINPPTLEMILEYEERLRASNFDLVTYNLEVWDRDKLEKVCPGKHELGGRDHYIVTAHRTIDILGKGHVGIIFTVGPWESVDSVLEGCTSLAQQEILPIPVVFHPGKGAEYSWMGTTSVEDLLKLYRRVGDLYRDYYLVPDTRTRAAGSEKSFRNSLINEAVLGGLD